MSGAVFGIDTRIVFSALIAVVAIQRLWELAISSRNLRQLTKNRAIEVGSGHYPWMVALHTGFLVSCVLEVWLVDRPWNLAIAAVSLSVLGLAFALRWWTLNTLGSRWTTRVVIVPDEELVSSGPYRWLRHPNYLAVVLEIAAIPMVHGAWLTAVVFSIANLVLLRERIQIEENALDRLATGRIG